MAMAGGAFQIRTKKWDRGIAISSVAILLVGFGGLFLLQSINSAGTPTLLFIVLLGIITFCAFAGPGIVYVLRKRNAWVKKRLPGGTMPWIRSHLYLPVFALFAAYVHATVVPFRAHLSSGKVLLVVGILVSIAGFCRHHLIGVQKAALNVNVAISKISTGQPRAFRRLVADFTDTRRPIEEIDAQMATMDPALQERWAKIKTLRAEVDKHFPRTGGQTMSIRTYKLWRALHPPLTILLFGIMAFHVWDVLGGNTPFSQEEKGGLVAAESCASCHSRTFDEWATSAMAHAQTSTITVAQLPVTLAKNRQLADEQTVPVQSDVDQSKLFDATAKVCITCHSPVGARFAPLADSLYPLGDDNSKGVKATGKAVDGGGPAVQTEGVECQTCHGTNKPPTELAAAFGPINDQTASGGGYGTVFGPLFNDPNPLPQRIHDIGNGDANFWNSSILASQVCAACHNVKVDLQGNGLAQDPTEPDPGNPTLPDTNLDNLDTNATPITDSNTAKQHDTNGDLTLDENKTDNKHDVVLQTTYDEWQDYVAFYDVPGGFKDRYSTDNLGALGNPNDAPLGCSDCHMPFTSSKDTTAGVVDHAPGLLSIPNRTYHEHTFVGVDYDLDPTHFPSAAAEDKALADREALIRSAVALKVEPTPLRDANGNDLKDANGQTQFFFDPSNAAAATQNNAKGQPEHGRLITFDVDVRNNLLAHTFPTGFAFARQFWVEVSAKTKNGDPVCLSVPFVNDDGSFPVASPCSSGTLGIDTKTSAQDAVDKAASGPTADDTATDLRQCDPQKVATSLGLDVNALRKTKGVDKTTGITIPNIDINFAKTFPNDDCDPWLSNFQKILTDGDPANTGVKTEVQFQSFLPDLVQIRGRIATGQQMKDLQPVRLDTVTKEQQQTAILDYTLFVPDSLQIGSADDIVVTATMRFRHLPPYFVDGLAQAQKDIIDQGFNVPAGAKIFDDDQHPTRLEDLLAHETVATVDTASSANADEVVSCDKGPQNVRNGSILDCLNGDKPANTVKGPGFAKDNGTALPAGHPAIATESAAAATPAHTGRMALGSAMALVVVTPVGWWRRRRVARRGRSSRQA
jgi:cytochrome c1